MARRSRTPLAAFIRQHPECLIRVEENEIFLYPIRNDGTANTAIVDVKDLRDEKLLRRMDSNWIFFACPNNHQKRVSSQQFNMWVVFALTTRMDVEYSCTRCKPDRLFMALRARSDGIYLCHESIPPLTTKRVFAK